MTVFILWGLASKKWRETNNLRFYYKNVRGSCNLAWIVFLHLQVVLRSTIAHDYGPRMNERQKAWTVNSVERVLPPVLRRRFDKRTMFVHWTSTNHCFGWNILLWFQTQRLLWVMPQNKIQTESLLFCESFSRKTTHSHKITFLYEIIPTSSTQK